MESTVRSRTLDQAQLLAGCVILDQAKPSLSQSCCHCFLTLETMTVLIVLSCKAVSQAMMKQGCGALTIGGYCVFGFFFFEVLEFELRTSHL
jgi:hypothetical protein